MSSLPVPRVVSCYFDDRVTPHLAAMRLRWPAGAADLRWALPSGEEVIGPPPERFGVWVLRQDSDEYVVSLVWNDTVVQEGRYGRRQLLNSALAPVLAALGTNLAYLLDQPIGPRDQPTLGRTG
jgi:hypothetical protein